MRQKLVIAILAGLPVVLLAFSTGPPNAANRGGRRWRLKLHRLPCHVRRREYRFNRFHQH